MCVYNLVLSFLINNFDMRIREITETVAGAIAGVVAPMKIGSKKRITKKAKSEDALIGGRIGKTKKFYGPRKGPKFTAGAGMKQPNYPRKS